MGGGKCVFCASFRYNKRTNLKFVCKLSGTEFQKKKNLAVNGLISNDRIDEIRVVHADNKCTRSVSLRQIYKQLITKFSNTVLYEAQRSELSNLSSMKLII